MNRGAIHACLYVLFLLAAGCADAARPSTSAKRAAEPSDMNQDMAKMSESPPAFAGNMPGARAEWAWAAAWE